jgi:cellulose synthase/poly-beta-1,6-N-acetylglucosamine synthase-like glycosyltransferase
MDHIQTPLRMELLRLAGIVCISLYVLTLVFILLYSLIQLHLLILFLRRDKETPPTACMPSDRKDWPKVTIQLPLYNEPLVVERLLEAIAALDYPRQKLDIQVLDDSTDETTALALAKISKLRTSGLSIRILRREHRTGFKAGALAHGLRHTDAEFIALFDADFVPAPDFLLHTLPWLIHHPKNGVVQTRWAHLNEQYNRLTRLQSFQLNVHFGVEQTARHRGGLMLQFNGTAGVWRRSTIEQAGGWQGDTLTEDLDLSYRAQLAGWKIHYLPHIETPAEVPAEMAGFRSQQFRWMKGGAETARKLLPIIWRAPLPLRTKIHGTFHLLAGSIYVILLASALLSVPTLLLWSHQPVSEYLLAVFLIAILIVIVLFYVANVRLQGDHQKHMPFVFKFVFMFPLFLGLSLGLSLHNSIAVLQGWWGYKTPFIRTPKWNLSGNKPAFFPRALDNTTGTFHWSEALLAAYFLVGVGMGLKVDNYMFLFYHLLLASGFTFVFLKTAFPSKYSL